MRSLVMLASVVLLLLVCAARSDDGEDPSDVLVLDASNFKDGVDKDLILVEFYAPWCGHCKRLAPEYDKAATALLKEDPPVPLAKVDCPANSDLCSKYGVSGYPTLKIFRNGELSSDYDGPRTADGIVAYMKKQSGPSSRALDDVEAVKKFLEDTEHSVVGFFSSEDSKLKTAFTAAANALRTSFRFGHSTSEAVLKEYDYSDQVVVFQPPRLQTKLEESRVVYDGPATSGKIQDFVKSKHTGLAGIRTHDNVLIYESKKPLVVVYYAVDYVKNPKGSNYWRNRVIKVAKQFIDKLSFAVSDKQTFSAELAALGLDSSKDVVAGLYDAKGQKFAMEESFSVDNLKTFAQQYLDGELEPYIKSEPIPEDSGPVKVVVGKNFNEVVNDETKDVLIEFYAPWCGHCKQLAPKYEELAEKLKNDPNIVIAKSDATANDYPPQFAVQGYPTIYWAPKGNKSNPKKYEGGREVSDFIDFLKKNASSPPVIAGEEKKKKKKKQKKEL